MTQYGKQAIMIVVPGAPNADPRNDETQEMAAPP